MSFIDSRDERFPIYLFIQYFGSILKIKKNLPIKLPTRKAVHLAVLKRFFSLYKIPCYRADEIVRKAAKKYGVQNQFIDESLNNLHSCVGIVLSNKKIILVTKAPIAAAFALKKIKPKLKKNLTQECIDLLMAIYQLEGVIKHETRIW